MNALTKQKNNYNDKISETVDNVLREILGDEATRLIYQYLETHHSLKQNEIAGKIDVFAKGLEEFLKSGAYVIEMKILENIYSSYGLAPRLESERRTSKQDFVSRMRMLRAI